MRFDKTTHVRCAATSMKLRGFSLSLGLISKLLSRRLLYRRAEIELNSLYLVWCLFLSAKDIFLALEGGIW